MEKTFCDGCAKEIPRPNGVLTKWKLEVSREEHDRDGDVETFNAVNADLCRTCYFAAKKALAVLCISIWYPAPPERLRAEREDRDKRLEKW